MPKVYCRHVTLDEDAVRKAIFHYESVIKDKKDYSGYASAILEGLYLAEKKLQKYNLFVESLLVKEDN